LTTAQLGCMLCFRSGLDPDAIKSVDSDPDPGGQKLPKKLKKKEICFEVLDVLF
jgi:hypothetical protein